MLWAIGYHQVPTYYVTELDDGEAVPMAIPVRAASGPSLPNAKVVGDWAWHENPFAHTQPFRGLDRRQPAHEQLGLEDLEQQDLRHRQSRTAPANGDTSCAIWARRFGKSDAPRA